MKHLRNKLAQIVMAFLILLIICTIVLSKLTHTSIEDSAVISILLLGSALYFLYNENKKAVEQSQKRLVYADECIIKFAVESLQANTWGTQLLTPKDLNTLCSREMPLPDNTGSILTLHMLTVNRKPLSHNDQCILQTVIQHDYDVAIQMGKIPCSRVNVKCPYSNNGAEYIDIEVFL